MQFDGRGKVNTWRKHLFASNTLAEYIISKFCYTTLQFGMVMTFYNTKQRLDALEPRDSIDQERERVVYSPCQNLVVAILEVAAQ